MALGWEDGKALRETLLSGGGFRSRARGPVLSGWLVWGMQSSLVLRSGYCLPQRGLEAELVLRLASHPPSLQPLCLALLLSACFIGALPSCFPDKGSIHKIVELPDGVQNIMELQVFPKKDPIQSMILDHKRVGLCLLHGRETRGSGCSFKGKRQGRQGQTVP